MKETGSRFESGTGALIFLLVLLVTTDELRVSGAAIVKYKGRWEVVMTRGEETVVAWPPNDHQEQQQAKKS